MFRSVCSSIAYAYRFNVTAEAIRPEKRMTGGVEPGLAESGYFATPEPWDSSLCMLRWNRPELLTEVDPNGYVVFVNGM